MGRRSEQACGMELGQQKQEGRAAAWAAVRASASCWAAREEGGRDLFPFLFVKQISKSNCKLDFEFI